MNEKQPIRPSKWFYLLGGVVILIGLSFFLYTLLHGIFHITDNLTQVVVPGEKDLTLQSELKYTIFVEEQSVVHGRIYSTTANLNGLTCIVNSQASGKKIETHRATVSTNYNVSGRSGRSVLEFVSEEAGSYHMACAYEEGTSGPEVVLAVGSGVTEGILGIIAKCFAAMFGGGILGGGIILTVFILRERAKKQVTQSAVAPPPLA